MSNFEEKFNNWRERMNQKTEQQRHNYALSVSFFITAIVFFFVASNWYFQISGNGFNTSLFTDIEKVWDDQTQNFSGISDQISTQKNQILQTVSGSQIIYNQNSTNTAQSTTSNAQ